MVTGWMLFTGTDTKGRRLLYIKKKNAYYLLPQHREFAITLWKHAEINAISISIILGYFLFHKIAGTIALALVLYAGLFLCLVFQQTVNTIETITAAAGGCIAVLMGVRTLYQAKTTGK